MELRTADPRKLKANHNNPRRTPASPQADAQMLASVQERGILQPPLVRITGTTAKGLDVLTIEAGHRRVAAAVKAGLKEILVLVEDETDTATIADPMNAITENLVRAEMGPVDRWRAMESLSGAGWTDAAIASALGLTPRNIAQLRLLARICPPMLDRMAQGDMPREAELRTIAGAEANEQLSAWRANKPKRDEKTEWPSIASALARRTLRASAAKFGPDEAAAFGIIWTEDLFAPADEDSRTTIQVDAFIEAQSAWLEANLPSNGTIVTPDTWGRPKLPQGAIERYGQPSKEDLLGHYVDTRSGEIRTVIYSLLKERAHTERVADQPLAPKARADVTAKGMTMIGDFRTNALHQALRKRPIDDQQLIGLLVLALGAQNVEVKSGLSDWAEGNQRPRIAERLTVDGMLTTDPDTVRQAAREMLVQVLSCREDHSASGMGARHAGTAIAADEYLPTMATDEFLPCLSKGALERAALASDLSPGPRAKDTRATIAERFKSATWVLPAARFEPTEAELKARSNPASITAGAWSSPSAIQHGGDTGEDQAEGDPDDDVTHMAAEKCATSDLKPRAISA